MYRHVVFPILKALSIGDAERAHWLTLRAMQTLQSVPFVLRLIACCYEAERYSSSLVINGVRFPNRVGVAAGLDKQAEVIPFLQALGFGFVEIGTVLPKPQTGNPHPRLARIPEWEGLWNWLGFNSEGVEVVADRLANLRHPVHIPIGGSLGKQKETPLDDAAEDYVRVLHAIGPFVNYYTVNISSPNTVGLRRLQGREYIEHLVEKVIRAERERALNQKENPKPVLVKLSPDLTNTELDISLEAVVRSGASGVIGGNTTITPPPGFSPSATFLDEHGQPKGGYSGPFQFARTLAMVRFIRERSTIPIIACGGITSMEKAVRLRDAGANLFQIYTGFVYQGPALVQELRSVG